MGRVKDNSELDRQLELDSQEHGAAVCSAIAEELRMAEIKHRRAWL